MAKRKSVRTPKPKKRARTPTKPATRAAKPAKRPARRPSATPTKRRPNTKVAKSRPAAKPVRSRQAAKPAKVSRKIRRSTTTPAVAPTSTALWLPAIFADHMVLQRDQPLKIWGTAAPGAAVSVAIAGNRITVASAADGSWLARLPPLAAGGPHQLTVSSGPDTRTCADVLVGEVWLASGQSNMEWWVEWSADAKREIAAAVHPRIRLFQVPKVGASSPQRDVASRWKVCGPGTIADFSAVAYYFGRDLLGELDVPIGLINSSWGGTIAEAWTSRPALTRQPALRPILERAEQGGPLPELADPGYQKLLKKWEAVAYHQDPGNKGEGLGWAASDLRGDAATGWEVMEQPQFWEKTGLDIDGAVWFRREVELPAEWTGKPLVLELGALDDFDTTYLNGSKVGGIGKETPNAFAMPRSYRIAAGLARAGRNVIAVRIFDHFGNGGFAGTTEQMQLRRDDGGGSIPLAGPWMFRIELRLEPRKTLPPQPLHAGHPDAPSGLYNGMIHPLVPFALRGALWYQGESNAGRAEQYRTLLPALINDWRAAWGQEFPFLIVQLANWKPRLAKPGDSDWAELREAQALTARTVAKVALAVAIDIGDADDIHPRNKQEVGRRLALAAKAIAYGYDLVHSGPVYESMTVEDGAIRVRFAQVGGGLAAHGGKLLGFAIAGADRRFIWATAEIDGDSVVVASPEVPAPMAVRYAWADNPMATLYNHAGLPAVPFRTDDWPMVTGGVR